MDIISKTELCKLLKYSDTTITKLMKEGLPVHSGGTKGVKVEFNAADCVEWVINYKITKALEGGGSGEDKALNLKKQNELLDLKILEKQMGVDGLSGKMYDADVVDDLWSRRLLEFKTGVEALVPKLAFLLTNAETHNERQAIIEREFNSLLMNLSEQMVYNRDITIFKELIDKSDIDDEEDESIIERGRTEESSKLALHIENSPKFTPEGALDALRKAKTKAGRK